MINRLKQILQERNISNRAIEQKAGLSNGAIKKWETQKPSYDKLLDVANALNVSIEWLITGKNNSLTPEEQELLENYRAASTEGQGAIRALANYQASIRNVPASPAGRTGTNN